MLTRNNRTNQRTTRVDTYCLLDDLDPQFEVLEISADGFSFACDREDNRFVVNVGLPDISIVNGEAQEIIHAAGTVRHRSNFDSRRDRIGVAFTSKRFDNTVTGRVRLPRHRPSLDLAVTFGIDGEEARGKVSDYNIRSARLEMADPVRAEQGDVARVTIGSGNRRLYDGAAVVLRSDPETSEIVVEFSDHFLELRSISVTEKAMYAGAIIEERRADLEAFSAVGAEYKALIFDWHMYLEAVEDVLDREEAKGQLYTHEDQRHYLEEVFPGFEAQMRAFIEKLNAVAPAIEPDLVAVHKRLLRGRLERFIRRSPLASSIMDKLHGYLGDFETVKQFFEDPFSGSTLFGKLMNGFIMSLEPVKAHVNRISYLYEQIVDRYAKSEDGIRVLSLGSGPAEEILRMLRDVELDKPVHVTLIDQDAHALADFYERFQALRNPMVELELMNFNIINILVGKTTDLPPQSYDVTYCAGMFDYFKDRLCRKFIDFIIDLTKIGGHFIYTNVHSRNFARYFMDYGGGWEIYHRDEDETIVLAPGVQDCTVETDETGTNVFVKGTRTV